MHKLNDNLTIAVLATISRCADWEEIEAFAEVKESWFGILYPRLN